MREIEIICKRLRYEVHPERLVFANVLTEKGTIEKIPVPVFGKDPRGIWVFNANGKGYSSFILRETTEWAYTGPTEVAPELKRRSPGIDVRYGDREKTYVTLEDALMAFLDTMKAEIVGGEFGLVCTPKTVDVVRLVVEKGWPITRVENAHLLQKTETKTEEVAEATADEPSTKAVGRPKKAREIVEELKAEATKEPITA